MQSTSGSAVIKFSKISDECVKGEERARPHAKMGFVGKGHLGLSMVGVEIVP